jgi:hypothetical protein
MQDGGKKKFEIDEMTLLVIRRYWPIIAITGFCCFKIGLSAGKAASVAFGF